MGSRKVGFHSGTFTAQDIKVRGDLTINDDIIFSDVSAGQLGVTGGIDLTGTTSAYGLDLNGATISTGDLRLHNGAIIQNGDANTLTITEATIALAGNLTVSGNATVGDTVADTLVLNGRVATGSTSGAYLDLDSTFSSNELFEIKCDVSDWSNISANYDSQQQLIAGYFRAQSAIDDAQGWLIGVQGWGTANGSGVSELTGVFGYAYAKGDTTDTVGEAYGIRGEFSMDAGRANTLTLTTRAAGVLSYITSGVVDDYTKIHGFVGSFGDMDGGSRTYGSGLLLVDGPESGTSALTNVIYTDMAAGVGINLAGAISTATIQTTDDGSINADTGDTTGTPNGYLTVVVGAATRRIQLYSSPVA